MLRWLRSTVRGEVSIAELEGRRRAGAIAYSLAEEADDVQDNDRGAQLFRLCAWNAFAFQTIVDTMIDSDTRESPPTAGFVPRSTLRFASPCADEVPRWIRYARMAQGDPDLQLDDRLPAPLPKWIHDEPTTRTELVGVRKAYEALQPRVETNLQALAASGTADVHTLGQLRRLLAEMTSAAEYASALLGPDLGAVARGEVRFHQLEALRRALELGQVLAMPSLLAVVDMERRRDDDVPLAAGLSWLEIEPGWLVLDTTGTRVGRVACVRGDRVTGEFAGIDVSITDDRPDRVVTPEEIATIADAEIVLR
ncbi:MAG: hypothetical protein ACRDLE_05770 [Gaiellaceae bacterium]